MANWLENYKTKTKVMIIDHSNETSNIKNVAGYDVMGQVCISKIVDNQR